MHEKIMRAWSTLDWSQSKIFLVIYCIWIIPSQYHISHLHNIWIFFCLCCSYLKLFLVFISLFCVYPCVISVFNHPILFWNFQNVAVFFLVYLAGLWVELRTLSYAWYNQLIVSSLLVDSFKHLKLTVCHWLKAVNSFLTLLLLRWVQVVHVMILSSFSMFLWQCSIILWSVCFSISKSISCCKQQEMLNNKRCWHLTCSLASW